MAAQTLVDDFLTVAEAADQLHVAPSTIRRWIREGDLPAYRVSKRRVAIKREDLAARISPVRQDRASAFPDRPPIRKLTPEERQRGLEAIERLKQLRAEMLAARGGKPFSPSSELIREMREERTRELSELV